MANVSPEVVFGMLFFTLSSANVDFLDRKLCWKTYITQKTLLIIICIKVVGKKKFAVVALDPEYETFVVYIAFLSSIPLDTVHPFCRL